MPGFLAGQDERHRLPFGDGIQAVSRIVGALSADAFDGFVGGSLSQQPGQHRRIPMSLLVTSMARISSACASMPR